MPLYKARVLCPDGHPSEIREEAVDAASLERNLAARGTTLIHATELSGQASAAGSKMAPKRLEEFTELAAALMQAGLSLRDALSVVAETAVRPDVRTLSSALGRKLDTGRTLAESFSDLGVRLPPVYVGLLRIGERIGGLETIFPRLSAHLSASRKAKDKVAGALVYPIVVITLAILGLVGLSVFVLPRLTVAFSELGGSSYTVLENRVAVVSGVGTGLVALMAAGLAAWPFVSRLRKNNDGFARAFDGALLSLPVAGTALVERETLDFTFAMELLVSGGLTIDEALSESAGAARNHAYAADISAVRDAVRKGMHLSEASSRARHFPSYLRQWFAVGERTGNVESVFSQLRSYYQTRTDRTLERLVGLAEPAIMLVVGAIILFMVVFLILPIFSAYGTML